MTLGTAVLLLVFYPETQYTRSTTVNKDQRTLMDNFRFWRVSGGGKPKVHRYASPQKSNAHGKFMLTNLFQFRDGLSLPFPLQRTSSRHHHHHFLLVVLGNNQLPSGKCLAENIGKSEANNFASDDPIPIFPTSLPLLRRFGRPDQFRSTPRHLGSDAILRHPGRQESPKAGPDGPKPAPETRLPLLLFSGVVAVVGTALFGGCTQQRCHWIAPLIGSFGSKFEILPCSSSFPLPWSL